jgi:hypothetical protein
LLKRSGFVSRRNAELLRSARLFDQHGLMLCIETRRVGRVCGKRGGELVV